MAFVDDMFESPTEDDYESLHQIFSQYCCLGTARVVEEMDGIKFLRFCRDLGLVAPTGAGGGLHVTDVDLLFVTIKPRGRKKLTFENFCDAVAVMSDKLGVTVTDLVRQAEAMGLPQPALTSSSRLSMTPAHHLAAHPTHSSSAHSRRLSLPHSASVHAASTHTTYAPAAPASPAPTAALSALSALSAHTSCSLREVRGGRGAGAVGGGGAGDIVPGRDVVAGRDILPGDDYPPRLRLIRTRSVEAEEQAAGRAACRPEPLGELTSSLSAHNSHEDRVMGGEEKGRRGGEGGQEAWGESVRRGVTGRNENTQGGAGYMSSRTGAGGREGEAVDREYGGAEEMRGRADATGGRGGNGGGMGRVMASAVAAAAEELRQGSRAHAAGEMCCPEPIGEAAATEEEAAAAAAEDAVASLIFFDAFRFFSLPHFARHHFVPLAQCDGYQLQQLPPPRMDSIRFIKLCKEAGLIDHRFTTTSADIIFSKVTRGGERRLSVYSLVAALQLAAEEKGQAVEALQGAVIRLFHSLVPTAALPPPTLHSSSPASSPGFSQHHQQQHVAWMHRSAERSPLPAAGCWPSPSPAHSTASNQRSTATVYRGQLQQQQQQHVYGCGEVHGYGGQGDELQGREVCGFRRSQSPQPQRRHSLCAMTACHDLPLHGQHGQLASGVETREEWEGQDAEQRGREGAAVDAAGGRKNRLVARGSLACPTLSYH